MSCRVLEKNYVITNSFANHQAKGSGHVYGVDIVGEGYTVCGIIAHSDGVVRRVINYINGHEVDKQGMGYGNQVVIEHQNGVCTIYCHLAPGSVKVKVGEVVRKGQSIGFMGNTGNSTGAHLDFSVIRLKGAWDDSINLVGDINKKFEYYNPEPFLISDLPFNNEKVYYRIQCGAYTFLLFARNFRKEVSNKLNVDAIIKKYEGEPSPYKVQVYAFESLDNAKKALAEVQKVYPTAFITTKNGIDVQ